MNIERSALGIHGSAKGTVIGPVLFTSSNGREEAILRADVCPVAIAESLSDPSLMTVSVDNNGYICGILVVEKDALLQTFTSFSNHRLKYILISGGGYPDVASRKLIQRIAAVSALPVYYLGDFDPHGIAIYLSYRTGGPINLKYSRVHSKLAIPSIKWIGVNSYDVVNLPKKAFLPLNMRDRVLLEKMRRMLLSKSLSFGLEVHTVLVDNIGFMMTSGLKAEVEALMYFGIKYVVNDVVMPRMKSLTECRDRIIDNLKTAALPSGQDTALECQYQDDESAISTEFGTSLTDNKLRTMGGGLKTLNDMSTIE